ncbi:MAG: TRAP transporter permease, partial [Halomonas sp.]
MTTDTSPANPQQVKEKISQIRQLPSTLQWIPATVTVVLMLMTLDYLFNIGWLTFVTGLETQFYYAVVALLLPLVFLLWPMRSSQQEQPIPWYDYLFSAATLIAGGYFVYNAVPILERGWAFAAPDLAIYASYAFW